MIKDKKQLITIIIGLISFGLAIDTMLQTPTVILPPWFLVLLFTPILLGISLTLGFLIKKLSKIKWKTLTISSVFVTIISLTYFFTEHRQTLRINVPDNFEGTVHLILSNESTNDFELNEYGIGYINEDTYKNGFQPKVFKLGEEITDKIENHSVGSASYKAGGSAKYFTFDIPGGNNLKQDVGFYDLIILNAIDTNRIGQN